MRSLLVYPALLLTWSAVAVTHLSGVWLYSRIGPLNWLVTGLAWLVALAVTALMVMAFGLHRRYRHAALSVSLSVLAMVGIAAVDWTSAFVHGYYHWHRDDFRAVVEHAEAGRPLPENLRSLALQGDPIVHYGSSSIMLPALTGLVDGATGYMHMTVTRTGAFTDCLGDRCLVRWYLGDGWFWLDGGTRR